MTEGWKVIDRHIQNLRSLMPGRMLAWERFIILWVCRGLFMALVSMSGDIDVSQNAIAYSNILEFLCRSRNRFPRGSLLDLTPLDLEFAGVVLSRDFYITVLKDLPDAIITNHRKPVDSGILERVYGELTSTESKRMTGTFPTSASMVRFMVRLALWVHIKERLQKSDPLYYKKHENSLMQLVLDREEVVLPRRARERVAQILADVHLVDPAVGGGAFLVGALHEIDGLWAQISGTNDQRKSFLHIVSKNLFGVDKDPISVMISISRLWLECYSNPSIRDFNIIHGDSLCGDSTVDIGDFTGIKWGVAFPEVFRKGGFDIVVANPPYIRQENIPTEYKNVLGKMYPYFSKRSDIYVYFYGLLRHILKTGGTAAFVTSASWLDVGYGRHLKHFLLENFNLKYVIESQTERWFKNASINSSIVLLTNEAIGDHSEASVRFVRLKEPLRNYLRTSMIVDTTAKMPGNSIESRVVGSKDLKGEKWGKYIRHPDIVRRLRETGSGRLCRLEEIADVSFGIKTGANDFFHLTLVDQNTHQASLVTSRAIMNYGETPHFCIEDRHLVPIVKSLKEVKGYIVSRDNLKHRLFIADGTVDDNSIGALAVSYIKWGEEKGFNKRPSCRNRKPWFRLPQISGDLLYSMSWGSRFGVPLNPYNYAPDARFYAIRPKPGISLLSLAAILNSTLTALFTELNGRILTGSLPLLDIKVYEAKSLPVLDLRCADERFLDRLNTVFSEVSSGQMLDIFREITLPQRRALDDLILSELGFTDESKRSSTLNEVYATLSRLVRLRLSKT